MHSPSPLSEMLHGSAKLMKRSKANAPKLAALNVEEEIPS